MADENLAAVWTIAVFGVMAALFGIIGLVSPQTVATGAGFGTLSPDGRVFATASSLASLNMGVYYLVATGAGLYVDARRPVAA